MNSIRFVFRVLANYMVWDVIRSEITWLSAAFRKATNRKYSQETTETKCEKERWQKCVDSVSKHFDADILPVVYVNDRHTQLARSKNIVSK